MHRFSYADFAAEELHAFSSRGTLSGIRLAYVGKVPVIDPSRFGETVAGNRGVDVKVFDSVDDALRWLEISSANIPASR